MQDEKLPVDGFVGKISSYMCKTLFIIMDNVYKACNSNNPNLIYSYYVQHEKCLPSVTKISELYYSLKMVN